MTKLDFQVINTRVCDWAKIHARHDFMYNDPHSYYISAMREGVISLTEFNFARDIYQESW